MLDLEILKKMKLQNDYLFCKKINLQNKDIIYFEEKTENILLEILDKNEIVLINEKNTKEIKIKNEKEEKNKEKIYIINKKDIIASIDKEEYLKWQKK